MKKITLTADEALIKRAQQKARADKTTLTAEFQRWLAEYAESVTDVEPEQKQGGKQVNKPPVEKTKISLAGCVDALKRFEKKLEEKL